ncbi:MAG: cysteine desulfurase [Clostridia bacterium]|jgi:cysteine desulfurase|nr:cysteine desulfurase [Clostridia bacterium]
MIYLDNAATTRMYDECMKEFERYSLFEYFNPSALYNLSLGVNNSVKNARRAIASAINADADEIIFTASGSEADNLAIFGGLKRKNKKLIFSSVEHSAVYNSALELKNQGYTVIFAPVDGFGRVDAEKFIELLDEDVILVSIMQVSNETGAVNDIKKLAEYTKEYAKNALFHVDGVQGFMKIKTNVKNLGIDLYSMSAHKIHGPKGVGALYIRKGVNLKPIIFGGGQEFGIRSATENVAGIAAFAKAVEITSKKEDYGYSRSKELLSYLADILLKKYGGHIIVNTDLSNCAPHILSVAFDNIRGEVMLHALEKRGIIIGTGSACSSKKSNKRIPISLGLRSEFFDGMLRISLSADNTKNDIDRLIEAIDIEYVSLKNYK